jgi:hypothetical protein
MRIIFSPPSARDTLHTFTFRFAWSFILDELSMSHMKTLYLTLVLHSLTALGVYAQETRLKGLVIPLFEHAVSAEYVFGRQWSVQLGYQNHIELGDNIYYHHRITPSLRYYFASSRTILDHIYGEAFHRTAFIRHVPDQSDVRLIKYQSQSVGLALGKQIFFRSRNMFMDFSVGRYFIYDGNSWIDRPRFDLFIQGEQSRTRLDFKLGFILKSRKTVLR